MKDKGLLNENYNSSFFDEEESFLNIDKFKKEVDQLLIKKDSYLEISSNFSSAYKKIIPDFKEGYFLCDDSFEALLTYHKSIVDSKNLNVINTQFSKNKIIDLKLNEKFDLVFSVFGLSFESLYFVLPELIGLLKLGGILALEIPAYWFFRENLNEDEKNILTYSKQNDKKWLFTEPLDAVIEESKAKLLFLKETENTKVIDRIELSHISSLDKLYKASIDKNIAVLETCNIPENNIKLKTAVLAVQKNQKTITKDNLFNF